MSYIEIIKTAVIMFPFLALLFTVPYMLIQYHKYGSIHPYKTFIVYSFILYLLAAYLLIILPLPSINEVATLTTPKVRLEPFAFVIDFINESSFNLFDFNTYLQTIKKSCFFVPVYNIFLCMPFGIYLHYYFKCDFKKTVLFTFLLSLFFELTQLTGLYFIYPRGYRLFDIDDLMLNTFGGLTGYFIAYLFMKFLPSRNTIDKESLKLGTKVSFIKRSTVYCLDFFIFIIIDIISNLLFDYKWITLLSILIYYVIIPYLMNGQTLGKKFLNLKITTTNDKKLSLFRIFIRELLFQLLYIIIPILLLYSLFNVMYGIDIDQKLKIILFIIIGIIYMIYYLVVFIKFIMKKTLLYESISHTKIVSTIEILQNCNNS